MINGGSDLGGKAWPCAKNAKNKKEKKEGDLYYTNDDPY